MLPLILALLPALALSALFAIAELAVFSLGESRIRTLVEEGFTGSDALARLHERPRRLRVLVRAGGTLGDVVTASLAALLGAQAAGLPGIAAGVALAFLALLLVGKLIPMSLIDDHILRTALVLAPPLLAACRVLGPVLRPLERLVRKLPEQPTRAAEALTEDEVRQLTSIGRIEGVIGEQERQLIERAFRLDETKAWSILTPRVDILAWPDHVTLAEIAPQLHTVPFSRVPVYRTTIDEITGVLYVRDAYQALVAGQRDVPLRTLAREPLIVPGSVSVTKLLRDFQGRRIHLAVVVDEYGGTEGIVTLEDALEELVGDIVDERDVAREPILRLSKSEVIAAGDADLREINHMFNTAFPQLEHRSLNGYLLEELGHVPEPGERVKRDGIAIEVLDASETQVVRAKIRRVSPVAEHAEPPGAASPEPREPAGGEAPEGDGRAEPPRAEPRRAERADGTADGTGRGGDSRRASDSSSSSVSSGAST